MCCLDGFIQVYLNTSLSDSDGSDEDEWVEKELEPKAEKVERKPSPPAANRGNIASP